MTSLLPMNEEFSCFPPGSSFSWERADRQTVRAYVQSLESRELGSGMYENHILLYNADAPVAHFVYLGEPMRLSQGTLVRGRLTEGEQTGLERLVDQLQVLNSQEEPVLQFPREFSSQ